MLPCSGEGSASPPPPPPDARPRAPRLGAFARGAAPLRLSHAATAGERRADDPDVEALAGDLDGVGLLDRLAAPRRPRRAARAARRRASSATCLSSIRSRQVSPRWPTARSPGAPCGTGSASSGPRSRTRRSARSMRCVACSRSASQTISLATIGSYIGEIFAAGPTPESTRTPGPARLAVARRSCPARGRSSSRRPRR